jgi:hypothetical protein
VYTYGINQFPCCTANFHQGWPKFANAIFGVNETASYEGIVVALWAPAAATTPYGEIVIETEYPFGDNATVMVDCSASFLYLRVPGWATDAEIHPKWSGVSGAPISGGVNGSVLRLKLPSNTTCTAGKAVVLIDFKPAIRLHSDGAVPRSGASASNGHGAEPSAPSSYSVHRGALLYSLPLHYNFKQTAHYYASSNDYDVTSASPWAWALDSGNGTTSGGNGNATSDDVRAAMRFVYDGWTPGSAPFNKTADPTTATDGGSFFPCKIVAMARDISKLWGLQPDGGKGGGGWSPRVPPASPTCAGNRSAECGPPTEVVLVPHGGTALRMGTLPLTGL